MTDADESAPEGRLDPTTLRTMDRRGGSHPLAETWHFRPDSVSPRYLELGLDVRAYPEGVTDARLDVRWFETGDYSIHYVENHDGVRYQCRWDRHPKSGAPRDHFHPPPDAGQPVESPLEPHHLEVLFGVLDWVSERVEALHG